MQQNTFLLFSAGQAGQSDNLGRTSPGVVTRDTGQAQAANSPSFETVLKHTADDGAETNKLTDHERLSEGDTGDSTYQVQGTEGTDSDDQGRSDTQEFDTQDDPATDDAPFEVADTDDLGENKDPAEAIAGQAGQDGRLAPPDNWGTLLQPQVMPLISVPHREPVVLTSDAKSEAIALNPNRTSNSNRTASPKVGPEVAPGSVNLTPVFRAATDLGPVSGSQEFPTGDRTEYGLQTRSATIETRQQPLSQGRDSSARPTLSGDDEMSAWSQARRPSEPEGRSADIPEHAARPFTWTDSTSRPILREAMPRPMASDPKVDIVPSRSGISDRAAHVPPVQERIAPADAGQHTSIPNPADRSVTTAKGVLTPTGASDKGEGRGRMDGPISRASPKEVVNPAPSASRTTLNMTSVTVQSQQQGIAASSQDFAAERPMFESTSLPDVRIATDALSDRLTYHVMAQRPELPRHVAMQLAQAMQNSGASRSVELALNPVELGRVRLVMKTSENTVTVHVTAERPETLELMRRNVETLALDFQAIGYGEAQFSFSQQHAGDNPTHQASFAPGGASRSPQERLPDADTNHASERLIINSDRVDIRV